MISMIASALLGSVASQAAAEPVDPLRAYYLEARACFAEAADAQSDWSGVDPSNWLSEQARRWREQPDSRCNPPFDLIDTHLIPSGLSDFDATMRLANAQICAGHSVMADQNVTQPAGIVERCERFHGTVDWGLDE